MPIAGMQHLISLAVITIPGWPGAATWGLVSIQGDNFWTDEIPNGAGFDQSLAARCAGSEALGRAHGRNQANPYESFSGIFRRFFALSVSTNLRGRALTVFTRPLSSSLFV